MIRLKTTEIARERNRLLAEQGGRCGICSGQCSVDNAVLDHCHATGSVRAAVHRGCNSLLGKIENNAARYGVRDIASFTNGVGSYLRTHMTNITGLIHPTYKTDEEKRVRRNTKARKTRAAKKESV
jgi:Autographiviridae endonuclease VII